MVVLTCVCECIGWEGKKRNKTQGGAAPGAHPSPGRMQAKGASQELHHDDTVRLSIDLKGPRRRWRGSGTNKGAKGGGGGPAAAAGGLLRRGRARRVSGTGGGTAGRPGGGAPSTPSSQRSAAGGSDSGTAAPNTPSSVHTMRSFTSNAEAVNLEHVKQEDPWEDEARAKYLYPHLDRRQPYEGTQRKPKSILLPPSVLLLYDSYMVYPLPLLGFDFMYQTIIYKCAGGMHMPRLNAHQLSKDTLRHAGESIPPPQGGSTGGLFRRGSEGGSAREELLQDIISHVLDVQNQTAARGAAAAAAPAVNPHDIQDVENSMTHCICTFFVFAHRVDVF